MNTKTTAWSSPSRYIQGAGIIKELYAYCEHLGKSAFILVTPSCRDLCPQIEKSYRMHNGDCHITECKVRGDGSEIDYYSDFCVADYIVGIGGGENHRSHKGDRGPEENPLCDPSFRDLYGCPGYFEVCPISSGRKFLRDKI